MCTRVNRWSSEESVRKVVWLPSDLDVQVYSAETISRATPVFHCSADVGRYIIGSRSLGMLSDLLG